MKPSDEFLYEHEVLRGQLALLEEQLPWVDEVECSVCLLTDRLAANLRRHSEHEERLCAEVAGADPRAREALSHFHDDHENQRIRLAVLRQLLTQPGPVPVEQIMDQAYALIQDLRRHLSAEEARLFPAIDQPSAAGEPVLALAGPGGRPGARQ